MGWSANGQRKSEFKTEEVWEKFGNDSYIMDDIMAALRSENKRGDDGDKSQTEIRNEEALRGPATSHK